MTILGIAHLLIISINFEIACMPLLKGKVIGLVLEERVVSMIYEIIFACFDDDLRNIIPKLKVSFDNEWIVEHYMAWLVVSILGIGLLLVVHT